MRMGHTYPAAGVAFASPTAGVTKKRQQPTPGPAPTAQRVRVLPPVIPVPVTKQETSKLHTIPAVRAKGAVPLLHLRSMTHATKTQTASHAARTRYVLAEAVLPNAFPTQDRVVRNRTRAIVTPASSNVMEVAVLRIQIRFLQIMATFVLMSAGP